MSKTVYFLRSAETGHWKVGMSDNPEERVRALMRACPLTIELVATYSVPIETGRTTERRFHERYRHAQYRGEWFTPCAEITADVEAIRRGAFEHSSLPAPAPGRMMQAYPGKGSRAPANDYRPERDWTASCSSCQVHEHQIEARSCRLPQCPLRKQT